MTLATGIEIGSAIIPSTGLGIAAGSAAGTAQAGVAGWESPSIAGKGLRGNEQQGTQSFRAGWQSLLASLASSIDGTSANEFGAEDACGVTKVAADKVAGSSSQTSSTGLGGNCMPSKSDRDKGWNAANPGVEPSVTGATGGADRISQVAGIQDLALTKAGAKQPVTTLEIESGVFAKRAHSTKTDRSQAATVDVLAGAAPASATDSVQAVPAAAAASPVAARSSEEAQSEPLDALQITIPAKIASASVSVPSASDLSPASDLGGVAMAKGNATPMAAKQGKGLGSQGEHPLDSSGGQLLEPAHDASDRTGADSKKETTLLAEASAGGATLPKDSESEISQGTAVVGASIQSKDLAVRSTDGLSARTSEPGLALPQDSEQVQQLSQKSDESTDSLHTHVQIEYRTTSAAPDIAIDTRKLVSQEEIHSQEPKLDQLGLRALNPQPYQESVSGSVTALSAGQQLNPVQLATPLDELSQTSSAIASASLPQTEISGLAQQAVSSQISVTATATDLADAGQSALKLETPLPLTLIEQQAFARQPNSESAQPSAATLVEAEVSTSAVPPAQQLAAEAPPIAEPSSGVKHDPSPGWSHDAAEPPATTLEMEKVDVTAATGHPSYQVAAHSSFTPQNLAQSLTVAKSKEPSSTFTAAQTVVSMRQPKSETERAAAPIGSTDTIRVQATSAEASPAASVPMLALAESAAQVATSRSSSISSGKSLTAGIPRTVRGVQRSASVQQARAVVEVQSLNPVADPAALTREVAGVRGAANLASQIAADSAATVAKLGGGETFEALDAAGTLASPAWIHAGSQRAEAGFEDPALGWVGVRAESAAGRVHAEVVSGSSDAAQALSGHMAGLNAYLAEHHAQVETLTLTAPESRGIGMASDRNPGEAGTQQGSGQQSGQHAGTSAGGGSEPALTGSSTVTAAASSLQSESSGSTESWSSGGVHISVIA